MAYHLWTIGHSTRTILEFLGMLSAPDIQLVLDVRALPYSRYNPQFNREDLARHLEKAGLDYHHLPTLGGRRRSRPDSINRGWQNASFRGYADYMGTPEFEGALQELMDVANRKTTAIMCAETVPWRCHRSLIADACVSRHWTVRHILGSDSFRTHLLTPFAQILDGKLVYPNARTNPSGAALF